MHEKWSGDHSKKTHEKWSCDHSKKTHEQCSGDHRKKRQIDVFDNIEYESTSHLFLIETNPVILLLFGLIKWNLLF